jgi:flagellar biosynthetic protein FliQ
MSQEFAIQIIRHALETALMLSAPLLIVGFIVGISMSLLSAVPRLAAFLVSFFIALPWMLQKMMVYTTNLLGDLSRYGR